MFLFNRDVALALKPKLYSCKFRTITFRKVLPDDTVCPDDLSNVMKFNMTLTLLLVSLVIGVAFQGCHGKVVQFIFGDSLSDVGNNKYLSMSLAQATWPYYGIDFGNGQPNGKFTNGRTVADIIGDKTGLSRPPAFLDLSLTDNVILENRVNYASGGRGILNETGGYFIHRLSLWKQIELFQGTTELIKSQLGKQAVNKFFQRAYFVVALGSNDFINNYLMPVYSDPWKYNYQTFVKYLMETLQQQLLDQWVVYLCKGSKVHQESAKKEQVKLALSFNKAASKLLVNLESKLPNASFKFGDAYDVVDDVIRNPYKYGSSNSDSPCCSLGKIRPALTCIPASTLCEDRSKYVFWDECHPSDSANQLISNKLIKKFGFHSLNAPSPSP